jgi:hypothetical protein
MMERKTRGMKGDLAIKIDISKAFDKVDWGLLEEYASLYTIIEQMDPMDDDVC